MRVLFFTLFGLADFSERHLSADLPRKFAAEGHEVWVVTQTDRARTGVSEEGGCHILRVAVKTTEKVGAVQKVIRLAQLDGRAIRALKKYVPNLSFDLIVPIVSHLAYYRPVRWLLARSDAYVYMLLKDIFPYNTVDMGMLSKRGWKGIVYRHFQRKEKKYYALCDKIGCLSPACVEFLNRECPYLPAGKAEENPNTVEPRPREATDIPEAELRARYGLPAEAKLFVYGGNLGKPQGVDFLLECIRCTARADIFYVVVGGGTEYARIKQTVEAERLPNAALLPMMPQEEFHRLLRVAYAGIVLLSPKFTMPNYPSRSLAYMEESLPILYAVDLACDAGRIAEENGFGINVLSGDTEAFLAAADRLADSPETARAFGARARSYLEQNYTVATGYEIVMKAYSENKQ